MRARRAAKRRGHQRARGRAHPNAVGLRREASMTWAPLRTATPAACAVRVALPVRSGQRWSRAGRPDPAGSAGASRRSASPRIDPPGRAMVASPVADARATRMNLNFARYVDKWVGLVICLALFALERALAPLTGRRLPALFATTPPPLGGTPPAPGRVLCIKFYGLGNVVMLLPVLQALREHFPAAEVDFLTLAGNVPLLERSGAVTRALGVDVGTLPRFLSSLAAAFGQVRRRRYDTVIDF